MGKRTWIFISVACLAVAAVLWSWGWSQRNSPVFLAQATGGAQELMPQKYVALTFDDGPKRGLTDKLLDELAQRGAKATFFLIGQMVEGNEDLVLRMEEEGHQVALHSYSHVDLKTLDKAAFDQEMALSRQAVEKVLGPREYMLRPPYGFYNENVKAWANAPLILWSLDTKDWEHQNADHLTNLLRQSVQDGDVVLMHDIFPSSVEGVLAGVDALMEQGYTFVTVEELFALRGMVPQVGQVYTGFRT